MITARNCRGALVAAGLTLTVTPAFAGDNIGLTMIAFVHAIDASPDWSAEIGGLSVDEASATVTIGSLVVAAERGGLVVNIKDATLRGFAEPGNGGFSAETLEIGRGSVAIAGTRIALSDMRISDVSVPAPAALAYDPWKPFTSLIGAYSAIAKSRSSGGKIAEIGIHETSQGQKSLITYRNVSFGALADGKLDRVSAGPLSLASPATDPLAELSVGHAEAQGIDLDAFLHVCDPLRYVAGIGDEKWQKAAERARYGDIALKMPGVQLTIGAIAMEGLELRQPAESFAPLIDATTSARKLTPLTMKMLRSQFLGELLSAFGVARFAADDIAIAATGIDQLTLGAIELTDASSEGFGEVAIQDFVAAIAGQGAVQVGRLALGKLVPPPFEAFDEAFNVAQNGGDVDISSLVPRLGSVEAAAIHMQAIDFPGLVLGKLHAAFDNHVGSVPTAIAVGVDDLDIAAASLPNASLRSLISGLGYDRIGVDANLSLNWREADGTVSLDEFELDIADFGNTTADLLLAGLTREAIEKGDDAVLDDLRFERARVTFEDRSVVDRSLSMRADLLSIPLDRLKQQLSGALPLMLAVLGEQAKTIVPVLQEFIKTPGTLIIEAVPESPVPVADIESAIRTRPQSLPGLLAISVSAAPGGGSADERAEESTPSGDQPETPSDAGVTTLERDTPSATEGVTGTTGTAE